MNGCSSFDPPFQALGDDPAAHDAVSASDDSSEDELPDHEHDFVDDEEELRPCVQTTSLTTRYVRSWKGQEAFRELYQNWKDAIIASFNLDPRSFRPVLRETRAQIQITIHRRSGEDGDRQSRELLGFIRFIRKAGTVELVNFQAELKRNNLVMDNSNKEGHGEFAGCHGEGFKLAAVVLRRMGHSVRFAACEYYWSFGLHGRSRTKLFCRLTAAKPETTEKKKIKCALQSAKPNFKRGLTSNIWEDVSVRIGRAKGGFGLKVSEEDFRSWLTVSIDLTSPSPSPGDVVQTRSGDLILDGRFARHIYRKGLRIAGHYTDYVLGYNFAHGSIGRDRIRLEEPSEELQIVGDIWEQALLGQRPDVIDIYIRLLREQEGCPEAAMTSDKLPESMARLIWERLRNMDPDAFFYCEGDPCRPQTPDEIALISTEFQKRPVAISRALWSLLRKFSLVRTPREERFYLFLGSKELGRDESDPFSTNVVRSLLASLTLHPQLRKMKLEFVDGGGTDVEVACNKQKTHILVHRKCLSFQKVHENGLCEGLRSIGRGHIGGEAFFCDHVAVDLFEAFLCLAGSAIGIAPQDIRPLRRTMREQLGLMPRLVRVARTDKANELEVRWIGNECGLVSTVCSSNVCYQVILHRASSCLERQNDVIHVHRRGVPVSSGAPSEDGPPFRAEASIDCDCAFQIVPRGRLKAIFTGLDPREFYFPMVARVENGSFFAEPPAPVAPRRFLTRPLPPPGDAEGPRVAASEVDEDDGAEGNQDRYVTNPKLEGTDEKASESNNQVTDAIPGPSGKKTRRPLQWKDVELFGEDIIGLPAFGKDEEEWRRWHAEELPSAFFKLLARREKHQTPTFHPVASLECAHLEFHFVKGEYALIRLGGDSASEHIIFIHDISYCEEEHEAATAYLLVTKYSKLVSLYSSLQTPGLDNDGVSANSLELLLHFEEFDKMGMRDDAELIQLDDIVHAADLMGCSNNALGGVEHVLQPPPGSGDGSMFCRFAIRGATSNDQIACLTPVASHLLQRRDRWPAPQFVNASRPSVVDFTPGILGPAEGFSQAGLEIQAALGFDQERHLSWKIRHTKSQVYDGPPKKVLSDIYSEQLRPPSTPDPAPPNIALIAGRSAPFRLNEANNRMPSAEHFVSLLDLVDAAVETPGKPDFLVMLSSPAMLHASFVPRFLATIINLLKHRRSVHIRLCRLQEHGLPQERSILLVVASPFCAPLPWYLHWPSLPRKEQPITLRDLIVDLDFDNPRLGSGSKRAFVCSPPLDAAHPDQRRGPCLDHVYNHQTGQHPPPSCRIPLHWDTDAVVTLSSVLQPWTHPRRQDLLTVRELARLQGFPDDFVFYHSTVRQYRDVWTALPPIISQLVGKTILHVIQGSLRAKVGTRLEGQRAAKRSRQDCGE
ncbi:hypothetical protein CLAIMM_10624 [Cladophialophora immunda]|nr:hypothetical protein CLAIMM_10624 [Cladophialophora immunda]